MANRKQHTIFVLCPDDAPPSGGIRRMYRHVDVLNAHGFDARLVHQKRPFRCRWFENSTRVEYFDEMRLRLSDFLVIAEVLGPRIHEIGRGIRTVIFNQNAYYTFRKYSIDPSDMVCSYKSREVVACIAVSEDNCDYLRYAFPELSVHRLHNSVDPAIFYPRVKQPRICFMPRKHADEAAQVLNIAKFRGLLGGFSVAPIDGASELETARILGESAVFLSFGYPEGCALPPMEAMASGCITIGYHGNGCREYLRSPYAYPIETGDIIGFAKCVEAVLGEWRAEASRLNEMTRVASEFIRGEYSIEREEADIVGIWERIFQG
jgi:glycosyltransferase involved in cell wall biosynthesis